MICSHAFSPLTCCWFVDATLVVIWLVAIWAGHTLLHLLFRHSLHQSGPLTSREFELEASFVAFGETLMTGLYLVRMGAGGVGFCPLSFLKLLFLVCFLNQLGRSVAFVRHSLNKESKISNKAVYLPDQAGCIWMGLDCQLLSLGSRSLLRRSDAQHSHKHLAPYRMDYL